MKRIGFGPVLGLLLSIFSGSAAAGGEADFWKWFAANDARLFAFEADQTKIFDELTTQLGRVNPDLTFEFGPVQDGKREFVISAGEIKSAFPAVEALYGTAPALKHWVWVKFRPRRLPLSDLEFDGVRVKADQVRYLLAKEGDKVGVVLFLDGYSEQKKDTYGQMGYLFLDQALGEYLVETQVGFIEFESPASRYFPQSHPLRELPADFDTQVRHGSP